MKIVKLFVIVTKLYNIFKIDVGIRTLVLTPDAKKYIRMALDENKANGRSDEDYIFLVSLEKECMNML